MGNTIIVQCPHCQRLLMSAQSQKTRTCPYCGTKLDLRKTRKIASAPSAFEASEILKNLKSKKGFKP